MNRIQFSDLKMPFTSNQNVMNGIQALVARNGYILDNEVEHFEKSFASYCESAHSVGLATGCDALLWAMEALGIGKGDEVITVANTFIGTVLPIVRVGATPVLVDCDPITQQIDPEQVAAAITPRTSAIVPVHLYGRLAPMDELLAIANKNNLFLLEDAAQAHGARDFSSSKNGLLAGSMGILGCFSFYPGKNLGAYGDAGAITTNSKNLYLKLFGIAGKPPQ